MGSIVAKLQDELTALAKGKGACRSESAIEHSTSLVAVAQEVLREHPDPPDTPNDRSAVSFLIEAAIEKEFDHEPEPTRKAMLVFFLTDSYEPEFEGIFSIADYDQTKRTALARLLATFRDDELESIVSRLANGEGPLDLVGELTKVTSGNKRIVKDDGRPVVSPYEGSAKQAIELLAWRIADAIQRMLSKCAHIAILAQEHYEMPGLTFGHLGNSILDASGRCSGKTWITISLTPVDDETVRYEDTLRFFGVPAVDGTFSIAIVMSRGAQDEWLRKIDNCPSIYFMTDEKLFETMLDRVADDPRNVYSVDYMPAKYDAEWEELEVFRNSELEDEMFKIASKIKKPKLPDLKREQILVLTCIAKHDRSTLREFRKTVSLEFPLSEGAVRWRASSPTYVMGFEIQRDAMFKQGYTLRPSWYMGGGRVNMTPEELLANPAETITREPKRWVIQDQGVALLWEKNDLKRSAAKSERRTASSNKKG